MNDAPPSPERLRRTRLDAFARALVARANAVGARRSLPAAEDACAACS